ncbi:MAG: ABC transporter permease [Crocinitomicaceae bacterium]|nr:ABC transporter permease [Crocinitomicaceae bacterium]
MKDKQEGLEEWSTIIKPKTSVWNLYIKEIWAYRDLLILFVKRDIITVYKQTVLGPIWFFVQPILTTLVYIFVFGGIAGISTGGIPKPLFYLSGIILWNYFADCFTLTSDTFIKNQNIFGKVYFPRLILPLSIVVSGLIKLAIQFTLFIAFYVYYYFQSGIAPNYSAILILPYLLLLMAGLGLGFGLIFSSLTTKYRDLKFLIVFGVQLFMYATPIIYPMSSIGVTAKEILFYNPLTHIIEAFKYGFIGEGEFNGLGLVYSGVVTFIVLTSGILLFNRTEKSFMDTV